MRGNGLIVWLLLGGGCVLMYAAVKGVTVADVLAGKAASASAKGSQLSAAQSKALADGALHNAIPGYDATTKHDPGLEKIIPGYNLTNPRTLSPLGKPLG